jgi:hypothetical protein
MYYGNPDITISQENIAAVWDSNTKLVQHMNQDPSETAPQMLDSTSNNNDGTSGGTMTSDDLTEGKIGQGLAFDGMDDYVNIGVDSSLEVTDNITIGGWIKAPSVSNQESILTKFDMENSSYYGYRLQFYDTDGLLRFGKADNTGTIQEQSSSSGISLGEWNYVQVTKSGTNVSFFINGENAGTRTFSNSEISPLIGYPFKIGGPDINEFYFTGSMDEVRVSSVARPADWIATEYNNQNSPGTFALFSSEQQNQY